MDRKELISRIKKGFKPKFLLFWGHRPNNDGSVGKGCLSQWWPAKFEVDGNLYRTAEHYMMAEKARLFEDEEMLAQILRSDSPKEAKRLGRKVRNFDASRWEAHCFEVVVEGNMHKFSQNAEERCFLLSTGERILVEAALHDRIWGIGMDIKDPNTSNPSTWRGNNLLGFALMEARERLRRSE